MLVFAEVSEPAVSAAAELDSVVEVNVVVLAVAFDIVVSVADWRILAVAFYIEVAVAGSGDVSLLSEHVGQQQKILGSDQYVLRHLEILTRSSDQVHLPVAFQQRFLVPFSVQLQKRYPRYNLIVQTQPFQLVDLRKHL